MKTLLFIVTIICVLALSSAAQSGWVRTSDADLRGTPSRSGKKIKSLKGETPIKVVSRENEWLLVQTADYVGWIEERSVVLDLSEIKLAIPTRSAQTGERVTEPDSTKQTTIYSSQPEPVFTVPGITFERRTETPPASSPTATTEKKIAVPERKATGRCKDGTETTSEEKQVACSGHGGVKEWYAERQVRPTVSTPTNSGGPVQVRGYYRKDGTYVKPHTRSSPSRRKP